jgi:hypothetical protein
MKARIRFSLLAALALLAFNGIGCRNSELPIAAGNNDNEYCEDCGLPAAPENNDNEYCEDCGIPDIVESHAVKKTFARTKWKLVGFFDIEKNQLIEPVAPKDCDTCYTLEFGPKDTCEPAGIPETPRCSDTTATIIGVYKGAIGYLVGVDNTLSTLNFFFSVTWGRPIIDEGDSVYFQAFQFTGDDVIRRIEYELTGSELKLYYNDRKNYLLFRQRIESASVIWPGRF